MSSATCQYLSLVLAMTCGMGCSMNQPTIPTQTAQPLAAEFVHNQAQVVNNRYLLLPQQRQLSKEWDGFTSGKFMIMSSAWSGFGSGSGFGGSGQLNLTIVNLADGHRANLFDRQVALGTWDHSFRSTAESRADGASGASGELRFPNLLILTARAADTNNDRQIDDKDSVGAFQYNLSKSELRQFSPNGYHVAKVTLHDNRILLMLSKEPDRRETAVYTYEPNQSSGRFVAERLVP